MPKERLMFAVGLHGRTCFWHGQQQNFGLLAIVGRQGHNILQSDGALAQAVL